MTVKRTSASIRLRVHHTCSTHEARWDEFDTTETYIFPEGSRRHVMTRCDGSRMEVWDDEDGVERVAS